LIISFVLSQKGKQMIVKNKQEAIDVVANAIWHYPNHNFLNVYDKAYELAEYALRQVVWEEPERETGRWIELTNTNHTYICSVCGRMLVNITDGKNMVSKNYPFCHCGAKMEVEE